VIRRLWWAANLFFPNGEQIVSEGAAASVSQMLGDAGACPTVTLGEKVWEVGWPTQRAKTTLEQLVIQVAKANVAELKDVLSDAELRAEESAISSAIRGGHHKTRGELWNAVCSGPESVAVFFCAMLRERQPKATVEDAKALIRENPREVMDAMTQVAPDFFRHVLRDQPREEVEAMVLVLTADLALALKSVTSLPHQPT